MDTSGTTTASYEYSPFGQLLRCEGEYAKANPFRFSTKFTDDETGLLYYGYRYYSTTLGRWISKDPLEEEGGLNLYAFCENNGINGFDLLGQMMIADVGLTNSGEAERRAAEIERGNSLIGRVRKAVEKFNEFQDFMTEAMDILGGLPGADDMFLDMLTQGYGNLAGGLSKGEGHHSIPKFIGGNPNQPLTPLGKDIHTEFHQNLHKRLKDAGLPGGYGKPGSAFNYERVMKERGSRIKAFKALLLASTDIDEKHKGRGALTINVLQNFVGKQGKFFR